MAAMNTSSAHRLEPEKQAPEIRAVKGRRRLPAGVVTPGTVFAFALVIALVSLMVYNQVQLNVLTAEMSKLTAEMEEMDSEYVEMSSKVDSSIGTTELKERAAELGMQKRDEYQTERIYLYREDVIERAEVEEKPSVLAAARLALQSIAGYFSE